MISWFEKYRKISVIITLILFLMVFYVSSITFYPLKEQEGQNFKAVAYHVIIFFLLTFFLLISVLNGKSDKRLFFISIGLVVVYAILDEIHQTFTPGRSPSLYDIGLDGFGAAIASSIYFIYLLRRHRKK